jgi:spore germination protein AB
VQKIPETSLVSSFLAFYLIHTMQIGVGIMGFQRVVAKSSGNDAWIAILVGGVGVHVLIWMIYKILDKQEGDITDVHLSIFGKWIGGAMSLFLILYFILLAITVLRSYIEIIQVWVFPEFNTGVFTFFFLFLVFYIINGGFRAVAGIAFLGVVLPFYLVFAFVFPLEFAFFQNLLPIMNHSVKEIMVSAKDLTLSILGFELLLMYYPFLKDPKKSQKWAQLGHAVTIVIYLLAMIISLTYYSNQQLEKTIWASITMLKIVELPFVERIEYVVISSWIIIILPNICTTMWAASRGAKRVFNKSQRTILIFILIVTFFVTSLFDTRMKIDMLNNITSKIGFILIYGYIPFLFVSSLIFSKWKESRST